MAEQEESDFSVKKYCEMMDINHKFNSWVKKALSIISFYEVFSVCPLNVYVVKFYGEPATPFFRSKKMSATKMHLPPKELQTTN
jgi:hypothetical protein